jgi:hypothetical protein
VNVATPGRNIVRERHVRLLSRFSGKGRAVIKQRMRSGMNREFVKDPVTVRTLTNETSKNRSRGRKTRSFAFQAGGKDIGESRLNLTLDMRRKKGKPNAKRGIVTKSMEGGMNPP